MKREGISFYVVSMVALLLFSVISFSVILKIAFAQSGQITIKPTDDTYFLADPPNIYLGWAHTLGVANYTEGSPPYGYHEVAVTWLKFNLSSIPNGTSIKSASLQLYVASPSEMIDVEAYVSTNNLWSDSTFIQPNMLDYNTTPIGSITTETNQQWTNCSVTETVTNALKSKLDLITIVLAIPSATDQGSSVAFDSTRFPIYYGDYAPRLTVITSSSVPPSSAPSRDFVPDVIVIVTISVAVAIGGFLGLRRRKGRSLAPLATANLTQ